MSLVAPVRRYARAFSPLLGDHGVASPLGAWLLLALVAPVTTGTARAAVEDALGVPAEEAAEAARELLASPPPAVSAAAAAWHSAAFATPAMDGWLAALPDAVERGPVPAQADADAWVHRVTLGLLDALPVALDDDTALVLATVLATRVTWHEPFDLAPASALGESRVTSVLRMAPAPDAPAGVVRARAAGDVGVHVGRADGLDVYSVIAAADVPPATVLDTAHELATSSWQYRSAFDLPLGDGHAWTVTERRGAVREDRRAAVLPAWRARSSHELGGDPALGFAPAGPSLLALLRPDGRAPGRAVKQEAVAAYGREGFEAAAVTVHFMSGSAPRPPEASVRTVEVRFARPYAVVAVATEPRSAWHGLPVFCAWVGEPAEPAEASPH